MKLANKIKVFSTVLAILFSLGETSAHANAGAKCPKVGSTRTIKGVSYICKAGVKNGAKATAVWVVSTPKATPETYTVIYKCGETFENSRYPAFGLDKLPFKPSSQSLFISGKTDGCSVGVGWLPSIKPKVNSLRNVSICFYNFETLEPYTVKILCDPEQYLNKDGVTMFTMPTSAEGYPFFGFRLIELSGYLGDGEAVWRSAKHLVMMDFEMTAYPLYYPINSVLKNS